MALMLLERVKFLERFSAVSDCMDALSAVEDMADTFLALMGMMQMTPGLRSRNYLIRLQLRLRLSKSFRLGSGSGAGSGSDLSFVGACFHSF
jgi:hypothetical protein